MTPRTLIKAAHRSAGAISTGQSINGTDLETEGLEILNMMLLSWFANGIVVPYSTKENFTLVSGTASYTIGSGATFDTQRPNKIITAFIRDSNYDYPLKIITEEPYWLGFVDKTSKGRPESLYYYPAFPNGTIYLQYPPDSNYDLHILSEKRLAEITDVTETFTLPGEYEEAIKYNLAVRLCDELNRPVSPAKAGLAMASYNRVVGLNASRKHGPVSIGYGKRGTTGNILSGFE